MKISVFGMGRVGGATAFALVARGVPHDLVLVGRTVEKTLGDAQDLLHASALGRPIQVRAGGVEETADSDIILLCASESKKTLGNRLEAAEVNAQLFEEIVPPLAQGSPNAIFVVLTNPVDVCTYVALRASKLPPGKVMGTGTLIDTARLRALLSRETGVNAADIRAYVLGEHGESQFPALSIASIGGERLESDTPSIRSLVDEARQGGEQVARIKGYTNYAVALSAAVICEAIANDSRAVLPVSTLVDGFKGVHDVCLSLPCVIGRSGVERVLAIELNDAETAQFRLGAGVIREVLDRVMKNGSGQG